MTDEPVFLVPLRLEALAVRKGAPQTPIERLGMGPRRAAASADRFVRDYPAGRPVVLIGVAGGLETGMAPGDVIVASSLVDRQGDVVALSQAQAVAGALDGARLNVRVAPIFSSSTLVKGVAARDEARALGAAVDMESYWCAPLSSRHPFAVVRVLLDVPGRELFSRFLPIDIARAYRVLVQAARALSSWVSTTAISNSNPSLEA